MSVAGSCFHLNLVTSVRGSQGVELGDLVGAYSATIRRGEGPDKIQRAIRGCSYRLSRAS